MTEIQVLIPLSVFGDAKDLTPQGISEAINDISSLKGDVQKLQTEKDMLIQAINNFGVDLEYVWSNSINEFERAKAVRAVIKDLQEFGKK